jgi:CoA:oxalate CoA-transferase
VLDLSRVLAGPYCTMLLADLGADVIKVERAGSGDETRAWGPPFVDGEAAYYLALNRGKRSIAVDLASEDDRELVRRLAESCDVVVENFKAGGAERLGLGFDTLAARQPRLVYCSVTGFGSARRPADRPGYDFLAQAESGLMSITGHDRPTKTGVAIVDVVAGLQLAVALLAALRRRDATGRGERVEVSLLDAAFSALVNVAANALATGTEPGRHGNGHPSIVPYETLRTADGEIALAVGNDRAFAALCTTIGRADLAADPRFATNPARVEHREPLRAELEAALAALPADAWIERLGAAGVPVGKVRGVLEALAAASEAGDAADFMSGGAIRQVLPPFRFGGRPSVAARPPPRLGEHTQEIVQELLDIRKTHVTHTGDG